MINHATLHGIVPPMCTPLTYDGEIDIPSVYSLVEYLLAGGVHGIFVLGSTGEFASLTNSQRLTLLKATTKAVKGKVPVVAGILDTSTNRCIENGLAARDAGADMLVLAPVYYFRASQAELLDFFRAVRRAVDLPLIAYDVPSAVNTKLELHTIVQLAEEGIITAVKDSSGNTEGFRRILVATRGTNFRVFTGSELIVDACLQMGAHGSVPGLANIFPKEYVRIYDLACAHDWVGAAAIQETMLNCFFEIITQGDPGYSASSAALGGFKTGLKIKGAITTSRVGAPLHSFGQDEETRVAEVMRRHGLI